MGRCFPSCSPLPSSSIQSFQSCCIATAKWCKIFLTSRLFIWRYCGVNILTIPRFYGFISPHLRPVVEAGGGWRRIQVAQYYELSLALDTRSQKNIFSLAGSLFLYKSSLIKASCRPESSKWLAAGFFVQSGSMFTSQYTQRADANRVSALSQFPSLLR